MPQVQPMGAAGNTPDVPLQPVQVGGAPNAGNAPGQPVSSTQMLGGTSVPTGAQMVAAAEKAMKPKSNMLPIILGVFLFIFVVLAGTFITLYVLKNDELETKVSEVDLEISKAVADAKAEQALLDAEEAKKDTRQFTGPSDYGQVSFDYPKLWSLYVEKDAANGGDYVAYFNPIEIEPVTDSTVYVLRLTILDRVYEDVVASYQGAVDAGELNVESVTVNGVLANRYTGKIPGTELNGILVIFKIRDKTVVLRTDSMLSEKDFNTVLSTVKFNA